MTSPELGVIADVRFAVRLLAKERWFAFAAIVALALAMGVASMMVTIINGYYWRGLPVDDPERVVALGTRDASGRERGVSYPDYQDWRAASRSFAAIAAFAGSVMTISDEGQSPDSPAGAYISPDTFNILPDRPILGRHFVASDDQPGAARVVMLGYDLWTNRYDQDPGMLGRTVIVDGRRATVVGVMPDGFEFPFRHALWQPLSSMPGLDTQPRDQRTLGVFGLLAEGVGRVQARAELDGIAASLANVHPQTNADVRPTAVRFGEQQVGRFADAQPPRALAVTALVILLIACANVANLLLARSAGRMHEIAVRASLGATRWRIVRQLLVESLILALVAGLLGLWLSTFGVHFIGDAFGRNVPYWMRLTVDVRVLLILVAICFATSILFGLAPALFAARSSTSPMMNETSRGTTAPRARRWTSALLVAELALTLILLAGGGLMLRSYLALYRTDRVIDAAHMLTVELKLPDRIYSTPQEQADLYRRLDERLRSLPGVSLATVASARPFGGAPTRMLTVADRPAPDGRIPSVSTIAIGLRYFETLGLRLLRGRPFTDNDGTAGSETAIVNQRFVEMYFPDQDPIGQRIRLTVKETDPAAARWITIVGVSPTVRQTVASAARPVVYLPLRAHAGANAAVIVGGLTHPAVVTPVLRKTVASLDPDVTLFNVRPLSDLLADSRLQHRLFGTVLAAFACIALVISAIGLYAVTAYAVLQRRHEIGVRMALGARAGQVVWLFVRRGLVPLAAGVAIGLGGALLAGQLLRGLLIQTSPTDPTTLVGIAVLLVTTAVAACFFPARRAARLDPLLVLRGR